MLRFFLLNNKKNQTNTPFKPLPTEIENTTVAGQLKEKENIPKSQG